VRLLAVLALEMGKPVGANVLLDRACRDDGWAGARSGTLRGNIDWLRDELVAAGGSRDWLRWNQAAGSWTLAMKSSGAAYRCFFEDIILAGEVELAAAGLCPGQYGAVDGAEEVAGGLPVHDGFGVGEHDLDAVVCFQ
jgi:hypothetical protein